MGRMMLVLSALAACALDEPATPVLGEARQEMAVCAAGPTVYGIDVSRFQGTIDWQQVKDAGVVYAYIQISRSLTDLDAKFAYNWRRAKEVGILRGAYQRFQPDQDVLGQANVFLDRLGTPEDADLPPMLDVEDAGGLTGPQIAMRVRQWMDRVEPVAGKKPLIYTGFYFWRDTVGGADLSAHPLWIANYGTDCPLVPAAWTRWTLHQYSSTARIPGITENTVDVNRFDGTLAELKALGRPAVAEACPRVEDVTIIDDASSCFTSGGPAQYIRSELAGHGGSLQWTHATEAASPSNFGAWSLTFARAGRYRIEVHTPAPYNESKRATYRISHAGSTTEAIVDQSAVDGWNPIGELDFAAGGAQGIRIDDNTGEASATDTRLVFDAVRLTRIPERDGDDDATTGDGGGCSTTRRDGGLVVLLAFALARRRRRR